jgi:anti-anti-sigma factor
MTQDAQPLLITAKNIPSGTQLTVRGEIDLATAPQLCDAVLRHLATASSLWLDLEGVTFMDSSGLHALIAGQRRSALLGNPLVIARVSPAVDRLLQVTGTTPLFTRAADFGDAVPTATGLDRSKAALNPAAPKADTAEATIRDQHVIERTANFAMGSG